MGDIIMTILGKHNLSENSYLKAKKKQIKFLIEKYKSFIKQRDINELQASEKGSASLIIRESTLNNKLPLSNNHIFQGTGQLMYHHWAHKFKLLVVFLEVTCLLSRKCVPNAQV